MGIFDKLKNLFKKDNEEEIEKEEKIEEQEEVVEEVKKEKKKEDKVKEDVKIYEKGLTKSRENFVSKLINLTNKYNKITE